MTHAHNIDSAISTAVALQGARFSTAALMRPQASIASTSILSQVVPKFISRLPSVPKLQKESPMLDIACGSVKCFFPYSRDVNAEIQLLDCWYYIQIH